MDVRGDLLIDPGTLDASAPGQDLEIVVPYTEPSITKQVLDRAAMLTAGLNARLTLVAVHTVPYQTEFGCPASSHAFLVEQLVGLASRYARPIEAQIVLAHSREEGFNSVLSPRSTVLMGTRRHFWRTSEESLARTLAREGHRVALLYVS